MNVRIGSSLILFAVAALAFCLLSKLGTTRAATGTPTFAAPVTYPLGPVSSSLVVADFNGDGKLDIATTSVRQNAIDIWFGKGDGTFAKHLSIPIPIQTGGLPYFLMTADLRHKHRADLLFLSESDPHIFVLLGMGDGTFSAPAAYQIGGDSPRQVAVGDFNKDGNLDVAVSSGLSFNYQTPGTLTIFLGNGDGSLRAPIVTSVETNPSSIAIGDFNRDGWDDIALTTNQTAHPNQIDILINHKDGTFESPIPVQTVANPLSLFVEDYNGDKIPDLLVTSGQNGAQILFGNGDGTFKVGPVLSSTSTITSAAFADFDGDGKRDLLLGTRLGAEIRLGDGTGAFGASLPVFSSTSIPSTSSNSVGQGAFTQSGKRDIAMVPLSGQIATPGSLFILLNTTP